METKERMYPPRAVVRNDKQIDSTYTVLAISAFRITLAGHLQFGRVTGIDCDDERFGIVNIDELNAFAEANGGTWKR